MGEQKKDYVREKQRNTVNLRKVANARVVVVARVARVARVIKRSLAAAAENKSIM